MPHSGYTGISHPFRISSQGGVVMTSTDKHSVPHIEESIRQILGTNFLERVMESEVYSEVQFSLFEPNEESLQQVIKSQIVNSIRRLEDRVEVSESNIKLYTESGSEGEILYATLTYKVIKYQTYYTSTIKLGGV